MHRHVLFYVTECVSNSIHSPHTDSTVQQIEQEIRLTAGRIAILLFWQNFNIFIILHFCQNDIENRAKAKAAGAPGVASWWGGEIMPNGTVAECVEKRSGSASPFSLRHGARRGCGLWYCRPRARCGLRVAGAASHTHNVARPGARAWRVRRTRSSVKAIRGRAAWSSG